MQFSGGLFLKEYAAAFSGVGAVDGFLFIKEEKLGQRRCFKKRMFSMRISRRTKRLTYF